MITRPCGLRRAGNYDDLIRMQAIRLGFDLKSIAVRFQIVTNRTQTVVQGKREFEALLFRMEYSAHYNVEYFFLIAPNKHSEYGRLFSRRSDSHDSVVTYRFQLILRVRNCGYFVFQ